MNALEQMNEFIKNFDVKIDINPVVKGKRVYHVPEKVEKISEEIKGEYYSIGLPLGEASETGFRASIALLDLLKTSENKVIVNSEAEWMFICARDIFDTNVITRMNTSNMFLVTNERGEVLGLGKWFAKGRKEFVKPLLDRGDFLRREEKRKKKRK